MCSAKFGMVCFCKFVFRSTLYFDLWYAEGVSKIRKQLDMKRIFFQGYYSIQEEKYNGKQEYNRRFLLWQHHYRIYTWQKIYFLAQIYLCTVLQLQAYKDNTIQSKYIPFFAIKFYKCQLIICVYLWFWSYIVKYDKNKGVCS